MTQLQNFNITDDDLLKLIYWRAQKTGQTVEQYVQRFIKKEAGIEKWGALPLEVDERLNREIETFFEEVKQGSTRPGSVGFSTVDEMMSGLEIEVSMRDKRRANAERGLFFE